MCNANCSPQTCRQLDRDQGVDKGGNQGNQTTLHITHGGSGGGTETFTPSLSYQGFRYASLSGLP